MSDDIGHTLEAKSDQLNAEDLIAGPRTVRVRDVKVLGRGQDQPVHIFYDGDNNKPFKPCKTVRRLLAKVWGKHASAWIGRSMTLYNDPTVKWAGAEVGGIRVSHVSHIDSPVKVALAESKTKRKPVTVQPLTQEQQAEEPDRATQIVDALIDRIKGHPNPVEITQEPKVIEQRDWLQDKRPELAQKLTEAFAAHNKQDRDGPPPSDDIPTDDDPPPSEGIPSDDGYEGG